MLTLFLSWCGRSDVHGRRSRPRTGPAGERPSAASDDHHVRLRPNDEHWFRRSRQEPATWPVRSHFKTPKNHPSPNLSLFLLTPLSFSKDGDPWLYLITATSQYACGGASGGGMPGGGVFLILSAIAPSSLVSPSPFQPSVRDRRLCCRHGRLCARDDRRVRLPSPRVLGINSRHGEGPPLLCSVLSLTFLLR